MKNWNSIIYALSGGLLYIISTEILPEWSHLLVSLLAAGVFIVAYWLIPNKMKNMAPRPDFRRRFRRRSRVGKAHLLLKYNAINKTASTSAVGLLVLQHS
ncbi:MAG: hypothetical protein J6C59_10840 [Muribaculaceae bacterium]|nr:hypothetical protein [Muribaculaceae bacterium]